MPLIILGNIVLMVGKSIIYLVILLFPITNNAELHILVHESDYV